MFPTNSTGLSFAGVVKWILILFSGVTAWMGVSAIVNKTASPDKYTVLRDGDAVRYGMGTCVWALGFAVAALAVWFFWQRNED